MVTVRFINGAKLKVGLGHVPSCVKVAVRQPGNIFSIGSRILCAVGATGGTNLMFGSTPKSVVVAGGAITVVVGGFTETAGVTGVVGETVVDGAKPEVTAAEPDPPIGAVNAATVGYEDGFACAKL